MKKLAFAIAVLVIFILSGCEEVFIEKTGEAVLLGYGTCKCKEEVKDNRYDSVAREKEFPIGATLYRCSSVDDQKRYYKICEWEDESNNECDWSSKAELSECAENEICVGVSRDGWWEEWQEEKVLCWGGCIDPSGQDKDRRDGKCDRSNNGYYQEVCTDNEWKVNEDLYTACQSHERCYDYPRWGRRTNGRCKPKPKDQEITDIREGPLFGLPIATVTNYGCTYILRDFNNYVLDGIGYRINPSDLQFLQDVTIALSPDGTVPYEGSRNLTWQSYQDSDIEYMCNVIVLDKLVQIVYPDRNNIVELPDHSARTEIPAGAVDTPINITLEKINLMCESVDKLPCEQTDVNEDNKVDFTDVYFVLDNVGQSCSS